MGFRIPVLGRKDMFIHLDVSRGQTADNSSIGGMPKQDLKLIQIGWSCTSSGASGSYVHGIGGSVAAPTPQSSTDGDSNADAGESSEPSEDNTTADAGE